MKDSWVVEYLDEAGEATHKAGSRFQGGGDRMSFRQ